ncbi:ABC transporter substrate-binding protein [Ornithinicoccus hortensis]|uniref:Iron(III) transport system substrate-binding protein n=1 Tax=Ornithinicoccus hortensis TaxID=82346 RepID=A0A542YUH8_9MICO|nr:ABC transporter substrate-binding protein [Ornithinicoccus hortensis]TQL51730.1 iron(III) transport system substrate-binding protein [Ornithinicoccus hortensis]
MKAAGALVTTLISAALLLTACSEPAADDGGGDGGPAGDQEAGTASGGGEAGGGSITVYTSEPQEKIDEVVAAFNEGNPDVEVQVFRAGTGDLKARIAAELETGEVGADILLAADAPTFEAYKAEDLLLEYTPADADALLESVVDPEGYYVGTRVIPTVIAYNTGAVDTPPTSWAELTDPAYAGQLVMPNPDVSGAAAFNAAVWLLTDGLGEDWIRALGENDVLVAESNGPTSQAIADGSRPVGVVVDYLVRDLAAQGSPVAVSYPSEGVPYIAQPAAVFASSANPAGAQAFVDFLVSTEGQTLAVEQNYLPVRADVGTPEGAPSMDELHLLEVPLEEVSAEQGRAVDLFKEAVLP